MTDTHDLGPLLEATGLLECIDDTYLARGDWRPLVQAFAEAVRAAERERCAKLVEAGIDPQCREIEDEALRQAAARIRQPVDN